MTSVTTRLKFILGCFPREIPLTEICYSVPSIFFVFLDDEAMLHQEFQPIVDSSETDVHIIPGGEIIVDGRRFERQTGIIEQFKNRVIVFPIHPLYTRAHLTRKSAVTRLEVPFMFTDYTFRRSLLHCTYFIVWCKSLLSYRVMFALTTMRLAQNESTTRKRPDSRSHGSRARRRRIAACNHTNFNRIK